MSKISLFATVFTLSCFGLFSVEKPISVLLDMPNLHQVEVVVQKPPKRSAPLLVFIHGESAANGAPAFLDSWFDHWHSKGYATAAISMPGYGQSSGKRDFCGPRTLEALNFAIDAMKRAHKVSNFGMVAFGQGGLAALLLTSKRDDINCLVCANGLYDFTRYKSSRLMEILQKRGYDFDATNKGDVEARSPILQIASMSTPLYLLHRKENKFVSEDEVLNFQKAMKDAGKPCSLSFKDVKEDGDLKISYREVLEETENWIDAYMQ